MIMNFLLAANLAFTIPLFNSTTAITNNIRKINEINPLWEFTLKKPNTWDNVWYDICIVNGLDPSWFTAQDSYSDLMYVKEMYKVTNDDISQKIGNLYKIEDKLLPKEPTLANRQTFINNSDETQEWKTKEYSTELKTTKRWNVTANIASTTVINFLFGSEKITIDLRGGYESTTEKTTKELYPSQTFSVKPNSTATLDWTIWTTTHQLKGGVEYELDWNNKQYTHFSYNGGKHWIEVNVGWTMWALANTGQEKFFKRGGDDLFIFENNKLSLNISQSWTLTDQDSTQEYKN